MRLATYVTGGATQAAIIAGDSPIRADSALGRIGLNGDAPASPVGVKGLLSMGSKRLHELADAAAELAAVGDEGDRIGVGAELGPPIPDPEKIICVGANYQDHVEEAGIDRPQHPVLFAKFANALIGPGAPLRLPPNSDAIDWEGELAVVIGSEAKGLTAENALDAVGGYMVLNDISARDLQLRTSQWLPGKALDDFAPCGPHLVTADEIADPHALTIETRLNGEVVQHASTGEMIFGIVEVLVSISAGATLKPGDVIATGTPAGVGFVRKPPRYLRAGDRIEVEIEGVGAIGNDVVAGRP